MKRLLSDYTLDELIAERDALVPRLKQEQRADWHDVRHQYLVFANEIARRADNETRESTMRHVRQTAEYQKYGAFGVYGRSK